jgi:acyl carrier protein
VYTTLTPPAVSDRIRVRNEVAAILLDMCREWRAPDEDEEIRDEQKLIADLGFESIDVVALVSALEQHYRRRDLPFVELVTLNGRYRDDLEVGDVVEFLLKNLNRA